MPLTRGTVRLADVVRELDRAGVVVGDVGLRRPTLDEVFLRLTGKPAEETETETGTATTGGARKETVR